MPIDSLIPDITVKFEGFKKSIFEDIQYYSHLDTSLMILDIGRILKEAEKDLPKDKFIELGRFASSILKDLGFDKEITIKLMLEY